MFRTIEQAFALIKKADSETAITRYRLRVMVAKKQVRTISVGKKILIDYKSLEDYLNKTSDETFNDGESRPDFETPNNGERRNQNGNVRQENW